MKKGVRIIGLIAMGIIVVFLFSLATAGPADAQAKPKYGGILKIAYPKGPTSVGLPYKGFAHDLYVTQPSTESLVRMDEKGEPTPLLATSWEIAPDGKSMIFKLRKGVKFHDGTDFNAEAVKFNMDNYVKSGRGTVAMVASTDVIDEYTVRFNLKNYSNTLLKSDLAFLSGQQVSPTAVKKNGEEWMATHAVGTGPFKSKSFQRDVSLKFEKFDGYWDKGKPYLDGIEFQFIEDTVTAMAALQAKEIDCLWTSGTVDPKAASDLKAKGFKITSIPAVMYCLGPDTKNPDSILADKRVREAIEIAIDREAIVKALGYGQWEPVFQVGHPFNQTGYNPDLKPRPYNPERAKQLLTAAGYPNGLKTKILAPIMYSNKDSLVSVQEYLRKVGIELEIEMIDYNKWSSYRSGGWKNALNALLIGFEPNMTMNINRYLDKTYKEHVSMQRPEGWNDTMDKALEATDTQTQQKFTRQLVKMLYDDLGLIPLWATPNFTAKYDYVNGDGQCILAAWEVWTPADAWLSK